MTAQSTASMLPRMRAFDANRRSIVYRLCKTFPPTFPDDYVVLGSKRSFAAQPPEVQRAAKGLGVFSTVRAVEDTGRKFPKLGTVLAWYEIPDSRDVTVEHLVGRPEHLTVFGDLQAFHDCLDPDWSINIDTIER